MSKKDWEVRQKNLPSPYMRMGAMKTKILVVEDDSSISELICMNLEAAGYEPLPFTDGLLAEQFLIETGANGRDRKSVV